MSLCEHLIPGPYPFEFSLVVDDHLGPTEALIRCRSCQQYYLIEMLDWLEQRRLFRLALPDLDATDLLLRDLQRGSCDLNRATEEVRQFSLTSQRLPALLLVDTAQRTICALFEPHPLSDIPGASWRDLTCQGDRIRTLQARL